MQAPSTQRRAKVDARRTRVMYLYSLHIGSNDIARVLEIDQKIVEADVTRMLENQPDLKRTGNADRGAADAFVAALFGELNLPVDQTECLLDILSEYSNPHYRSCLQERIQRMKTGLAAKTAEVDRLKDVLGDIQRATNATIGENHPRRWNENLFKRCDELDLSVRSANCLQNAGIEYVYEMCAKSEAEMLRCDKNFGRKSLNEIKEILADLGLSLGMNLTGFPGKKIEPPEAPKDPGKTHVNDMCLSVGTINILRDNGLEFADDVAGRTETEVLKLLKNSKKQLKEVSNALRDLGLSFKQ